MAASDQPCDERAVRLATSPIEQAGGPFLAMARRLRDVIPEGPTTLFIGDSLTRGWPADLQQRLAPSTPQNRGVSADKTQNTLYNLGAPRLGEIAADRIFILIGTNNLGAGEPVCAIEAGVAAVANKTRAIWPKATLVLLGIPPRGRSGAFRLADRKRLNARIEALAASLGARYASLDTALTCPTPDACGLYTVDALHLERPGYEAMTAAIAAALRPRNLQP